MDAAAVRTWLKLTASLVQDNRAPLTALDAAIGDADFGANLDRGFSAVAARLPEWDGEDLGPLLAGAARTLITTVGGSSGVFFGTALQRMGVCLAGKTSADVGDMLEALQAAAAGVAARGHAALGDKTMLDAWAPAVEAFRQSVASGGDMGAATLAAARAAKQGAESTVAMVAVKGRAANLGPRSAGHMDPGAAATALLFEALAAAQLRS